MKILNSSIITISLMVLCSAYFVQAKPVYTIVSALQMLTYYPSTPTGSYYLDPDGPDTGSHIPIPVYCDMATEGGGWSLIFDMMNDLTPMQGLLSDPVQLNALLNNFSPENNEFLFLNETGYGIWSQGDTGYHGPDRDDSYFSEIVPNSDSNVKKWADVTYFNVLYSDSDYKEGIYPIIPEIINNPQLLDGFMLLVREGDSPYYLVDQVVEPTPVSSNPVPEPTTMLLFGIGISGLVAARRKKV